MLTYKDCGVSIDGNDRLVQSIRDICQPTYTPGVMSGVGDFCSLFEVPGTDQIISSCTDGIGSKLFLAEKLKDYGYLETVGFDLIGMVINDLLPCGSMPLFFQDYLAVRSIEGMDERINQLLKGISAACKVAGVALIGGETAELPHLFPSSSYYDVSGFGVGIVNKRDVKGKHLVRVGNSVIGIESSGPHSNGYSFIQKAFENYDIASNLDFMSDIMKPTIIYSRLIRKIVPFINAMAHITGGGIKANTLRSVPDDLDVSWDLPSLPPLFSFIQEVSGAEEEEMRRVFNCGIGFTLIVDKTTENSVINSINDFGYKAFKVGTVINKN